MNNLMRYDQKVFDQAAKVISWNNWLLSTLGLWPQVPNNFLFSINFGYFVYHMSLEYLDLFLFIDNLEHVIENLTENMAFTQIIMRIAMLKKYNRQLGAVINEALKDYDIKKYRNSDECKAFIDYMNKAKLFVKLLCIFVAMTASSYFMKPITSPPPVDESDDMDQINATIPFILPYRFYVFYTINDSQTYMLTYASQFPFVFISGFGQTAADCLMVTLVFHVSGKLAVLAIRISEIKCDDAKICKVELNDIINEHSRLLRMGESIEEAFSETLLVHLVGATSLVCILGFQLLSISRRVLYQTASFRPREGSTIGVLFQDFRESHRFDKNQWDDAETAFNSRIKTGIITNLQHKDLSAFLSDTKQMIMVENYSKGQNADIATFFVFIFLVFLVLYAHCVVGESLVTESHKVCEAYYDCKWYEMPKNTAKCLILCMARSQKPLGLTAGKFGTFCLSTLTDVVKTAMAYLSVLRSFLAV
ncbi:hypothetical protein PV328_001475 [Microctonus aethiopoides]|uniref:Odorant receptor n=1 Tax=Microctonus aethiopoides TaxID=144406 RepID=A0AA39FX25_9HYME|nr:hypothetical protein PV328_001475 [Microctonus aethiopoides]